MAVLLHGIVAILILIGNVNSNDFSVKLLDGTSKDASPDHLTGYVALPERGMLLERTGTLIIHPNFDLLSIVISLDKPQGVKDTDTCAKFLSDVDKRITEKIKKYHDMTDAIFNAREKLSDGKICTLLKHKNCDTLNSRKRRFFLGAAALATATTALGLGIANKVQIEKIENHVALNDEKIHDIQTQLQQQRDNNEELVAHQNQIYAYIVQLEKKLEHLQSTADCVAQYTYYSMWANDVLSEVENLLQFILEGKTFGRLNPRLIDPLTLQNMISSQTHLSSSFFTKYPNMLYQTSLVNLMSVNFDTLTWHFVLMYPSFDNTPLVPFFSVRQVGFLAHVPQENVTVCLRFLTPSYAIIENGQWYMLDTPTSCPIFGSVMICQDQQIVKKPFKGCLRTQNTSSVTCPMARCYGTKYISTPGGILLRTSDPSITIIMAKSSTMGLGVQSVAARVKVPTPPYQTLFVAWNKSVSSVIFDETVIYSPVNADFTAKISRPLAIAKPNLTWSDILDVPDVGAERLSSVISSQRQNLAKLDNAVRKLTGNIPLVSPLMNVFRLPSWIKLIAYAAAATTGLMITVTVAVTIRRLSNRCHTLKSALTESATCSPNEQKTCCSHNQTAPNMGTGGINHINVIPSTPNSRRASVVLQDPVYVPLYPTDPELDNANMRNGHGGN